MGGLLALLFVTWVSKRPGHVRVRVLAIGLVVVAWIYVLFSMTDFYPYWFAIEIAGVLIFSAFAVLSFKYSVWFLAAGWLIHVAWDVVLHGSGATPFVPGWYPGLCLGFDVVVGGDICVKKKELGCRS